MAIPRGSSAELIVRQHRDGDLVLALEGPYGMLRAVQAVGTGPAAQGASTLFWIVSLVIGVAVGALAYVIVLQL